MTVSLSCRARAGSSQLPSATMTAGNGCSKPVQAHHFLHVQASLDPFKHAALGPFKHVIPSVAGKSLGPFKNLTSLCAGCSRPAQAHHFLQASHAHSRTSFPMNVSFSRAIQAPPILQVQAFPGPATKQLLHFVFRLVGSGFEL
eukprot:scaffold311803_cov19-Tisochrysis_lutea.AAC.1